MDLIPYHQSLSTKYFVQFHEPKANKYQDKINNHVILMIITLAPLESKLNVLLVCHVLNGSEHHQKQHHVFILDSDISMNALGCLLNIMTDVALPKYMFCLFVDHHICCCCFDNWYIFHWFIFMGKWCYITCLTHIFNDTTSQSCATSVSMWIQVHSHYCLNV